MAGDYLKPPEWNSKYVAERALANMIARDMPLAAIERIRALLKAWEFVEREFDVFREPIQRFENTADGSHWGPDNISWLRNLVNEALQPKAADARCTHTEIGLRCRPSALHTETGEPHVY